MKNGAASAMTTALITHRDCLHHVTPPGHPERVDRLRSLHQRFADAEFAELARFEAPLGDVDSILRAHPQEYYDGIVRRQPTAGITSLDPDTHMSPGSLDAARRAVGANLLAVDLVMRKRANNAFCAVRPPGHHAEAARAMGFCLFANVMIGALHALETYQLNRVGIVDFDVHHGNGTSALAWDDARIFFASSHEMPLFPGTGDKSECGAHGQIVNVPLASGTDGREFRQAMMSEILPALADHKPEFIFISAGFDAHYRDPLASLKWSEDDYFWATTAICDVADEICAGRVVSSLEGGYDLNGLQDAAAAHLRALMNTAR